MSLTLFFVCLIPEKMCSELSEEYIDRFEREQRTILFEDRGYSIACKET